MDSATLRAVGTHSADRPREVVSDLSLFYPLLHKPISIYLFQALRLSAPALHRLWIYPHTGPFSPPPHTHTVFPIQPTTFNPVTVKRAGGYRCMDFHALFPSRTGSRLPVRLRHQGCRRRCTGPRVSPLNALESPRAQGTPNQSPLPFFP